MGARGLEWFRVYADWLQHPKVQRLSEVDQRRHIGILCLACAGRLDIDDIGALAFELRISDDEAAGTIERLIAAKLLTPDGQVYNWAERQPKRDCSTERVRAFRSRSKGEGNALHETVKREGTKGNGSGTRIDKTRGEETREPSGSSSSASPQKNNLVASQFDENAQRLAALLRDLIVRNDPCAKVPERESATWLNWIAEIDRLCRIDGRSWSSIEAAIRYTQADTFWRSNVLSPGKLRKQFPMIALRMQANGFAGAAAVVPQIDRYMIGSLENVLNEGEDLEAWISKQPPALHERLRQHARARQQSDGDQVVQ